jgi:alpha-1,2-mannosyltransferase
MKSRLASGAWATPARVRAYLTLLAAGNLVGLAAAICRAHGWGLPTQPHLAVEFISYLAAGRLALAGHAATVYAPGMAAASFIASPHMPPAHAAMEAALAPDSVYFAYFYPPVFLLLCAPLAYLTFYPAFFVWVGLTGALLASGLRRLGAGGPFVLATFAYLPITENAAVGESAFLATGLLAWALAWLTRRPALAGCILAGLAVKPQFLLPIGLFLLFGRRWRALGGLAGGVVLLVGLAAWLFGLPAWWLYATITVPHAAWVFAHGGVSYALQITPASAMLQLGALRVPVLAVQAAFSLFAVAALWRARRAPLAVQGAMLAATFPLLLTTMLVYDATICGIAILLLWQEALRTGFLPYEKTVLALLFVAPLITFILRPVNVPLDPLIPALFLLSLRRRCATDPATTKPASPASRLPYTPPETKPAR